MSFWYEGNFTIEDPRLRFGRSLFTDILFAKVYGGIGGLYEGLDSVYDVIAGRSHLNVCELPLRNRCLFGRRTPNTLRLPARRRSAISAEYSDGRSGGSGAGDFFAGVLVGGAVFGTLAYVFAPQIRRSLLNEDDYGFRRAKRPIYYEDNDGLEKTRQTLNAKLSQLNSAIDKVSSRLRGNDVPPPVPVEFESNMDA
ncbi:hypothetical protein AKJ16_DCAP23261 [Drosera capensis]